MSEEDKPKLGLRPKLGVKRTTEVSQVKQSFSHGRTHKVVVETKKARSFKRAATNAPEPEELEEAVRDEPPAAEPAVPETGATATVPEADTDAPGLPKAPPPPFHVYDDTPLDAGAPETEAEAESAPAADTVAADDTSPVPEAEAPATSEVETAGAEVTATETAEEPVPEAAKEPAGKKAAKKKDGKARKAAIPAAALAKALETTKPQAATPPPATQEPAAAPVLSPTQKALQNPKLTLRERQQLLLRLAEEERLQLAEQKRIRETEERVRAEEEERLRLEEKARLEAEEAERAKREAEREEAAAKLHAARGPEDAPGPERTDDKPARGRGRERRKGKLTISRALRGDEGGRTRSLAAMRRASLRHKGGDHGGGAAAKSRTPREVQVPEAITVQELANRMAERGAALVKALFNMGMATTINATIDQDTAELLVTEFGHTVKRVSDADVEIGVGGEPDREEDMQPRPPVVAIMGHVDHGKTSLLDALRHSDRAAGEAGGITQHIGAYQVVVPSGEKITFLDTPGHEAFTQMRARGANVTDIVILVVAADDGIMPQTQEAIAHIKAAGVPMIVAINKIDKPEANADKVRTDLLQYDVQVEKMGGDVQAVEVSALKKIGLDDLIEKILLQAELMELKANPDRPAEATVIEAKLDKGRGPLASVLVQRGTLRRGDIFVVGTEWGKVRALVNENGKQLKEAGPADAVEVLGLSGVPQAGDLLTALDSETRAKEISTYRQEVARTKRTSLTPASLESMFSAISDSKAIEFPAIVKADVHGSTEAIVAALNKLSTDEIKVRILHSGVGAITESDVTLARASDAVIIGFNVRANAKAREAARQAEVPLKYYDIIYDLIDEVKAGMAGKLGPERFENVVGRADVREVFQAGKFGKAAGAIVTEGYIRRNLKARVLRDDVIVHNGTITSLRRFKDDVTEVQKGYECGIAFDNFQDLHEGDVIETFEVEERLRSL